MLLKDINIATWERLLNSLGRSKKDEMVREYIFGKKVSLEAYLELMDDFSKYVKSKPKNKYIIGKKVYYPAGVLRVDQQIRYENAVELKDVASCFLVDEKGELADPEYLNEHLSVRDYFDLCGF